METPKDKDKAAKGNGAANPVPVIDRSKFKLREYVTNIWVATLPPGATKADVALASTYSKAPDGLERFDTVSVVAHDDSFLADVLVLEGSKQGVAVLVRSIIDLPPRREADGGASLPPGFQIRMGTTEEGLIVSRTNPDGTKQVMTMGRDHPEWRNDVEAARTWLRGHATFQK